MKVSIGYELTGDVHDVIVNHVKKETGSDKPVTNKQITESFRVFVTKLIDENIESLSS